MMAPTDRLLVPEASAAAETKTTAPQWQCHRNSKLGQRKQRRGKAGACSLCSRVGGTSAGFSPDSLQMILIKMLLLPLLLLIMLLLLLLLMLLLRLRLIIIIIILQWLCSSADSSRPGGSGEAALGSDDE